MAQTVSEIRERRNWQIHLLYVRQEYSDCLALIEEQLQECRGLCEYALYVKGLICRIQGELQQSLSLFQAAAMLNPHSADHLKQVGRALHLLGKHRAAIDVYSEAVKYCGASNWELLHHMGLCFFYLKNYEKAESLLRQAIEAEPHESSYLQLGRLFAAQQKYTEAIEAYLAAIPRSPENPELLTTTGLLYLRIGETYKAFDYLGNSLTYNAREPKTILAAGSIIQDHRDFDVALSKYRVAAVETPDSPQLWNNIGMCFFGKNNIIAAISSLRRSFALSPFEWISAHNLGIVFLHSGQLASAFHYLSASIDLRPNFANSYMYLGICLARMDDPLNAYVAYDKALSIEPDAVTHLNYSISLYNNNELQRSREQFNKFLALYEQMDPEEQQSDTDVVHMVKVMRENFSS